MADMNNMSVCDADENSVAESNVPAGNLSNDTALPDFLPDNMEMKEADQMIRMIPVKLLKIANYQCGLIKKNVEAIVKNFDPAKLGVLVVSHRADGYYYVIDGQHRTGALRLLGITHVNCLVLEGMTVQQEADYFRRQNENKHSLSAVSSFNAGVCAGDKASVEVNDIMEKNGFSAVDTENHVLIRAIKTVQVLYGVYGSEVLDVTLASIAKTWPRNKVILRSEMLSGMAEFWYRFKDKVTLPNFEKRMRKKNPADLFRQASGKLIAAGSTSPALNEEARGFVCQVLAHNYNARMPIDSPNRLDESLTYHKDKA